MMKHILCCDYGIKRIGAALGDEETGLVFLKKTYTNTKTVYEELLQTIEQKNVEKIVIGLPLNMKCEFTESTKNAVTFANKLDSLSGKTVFLIDERFSTKTVYLYEKQLGYSEKDTRKRIDEQSAEEILYRYFSAPFLASVFSRVPMNRSILKSTIDGIELREQDDKAPVEILVSGIDDFSLFSFTKHHWVLKEKNPWFYMKNREKEKPKTIIDYRFFLNH
jgi:putative Holliday junction resolvase